MSTGTLQRPFPSDALAIDVHTFSSSTADKFTLSNSYRGFVIGLDSGNARNSVLLVTVSASGVVTCTEIYKGSGLTIDSSVSNALTISHTSNSPTYMVFTIRGSVAFG